MKVTAFRVDASLQIGSGHAVRCLTLADVLVRQGLECHFLCREHEGHLIDFIRGKGYYVHVLPCEASVEVDPDGLVHGGWLGASQEQDVDACRAILQSLRPDWLIVDHYALDARWERQLRAHCRRLMVIDDLADREHACDLLLDQNLGRQESDYHGLVPQRCRVLAGPAYALLRPEFAELRAPSLRRRGASGLRHLLVTMGGVDQHDATGRILYALKQCALPSDCEISVIMGSKAPWLERVRILAAEMPWPTEVLVNVSDMAQRMADCDLAIGAAGGTAWERCCLGVPTLMVVLAENQWPGARALQAVQAAELLGDAEAISRMPDALDRLGAEGALQRMAQAAADVTDGRGASRVLDSLIRLLPDE
jgi:UDP-2,4-diacetamido-2,4,6-trideoxy-beta-L-altropyranose hydrolase